MTEFASGGSLPVVQSGIKWLGVYKGIFAMKYPIAAASAALMALSVSGMASADDKLKYEDQVHCAATNVVIAGVLSLDDGQTKNKTQIDTFNSQAAALMAIASIGASKDTKVVQADMSKETDMIIALLGDKEKSKGFIDSEVPKCNSMGQAAVQVVNESKSSK